MNKETTASRLRYLMEKRNIKQIDILRAALPYAKEYGIKLNRSDISQYVSGKVEPRQTKLIVLGKALNVDPVWLMGIDTNMYSLGERIKLKREEYGLSVEDLSRMSGIDQNVIRQYESGEIKTPKTSVLRKLSYVFDMDVFELICWDNVVFDDLDNLDKEASPLSAREKEMIKKYRALSIRGKELVDIVLDKEYNDLIEEFDKMQHMDD